MKKIYLFALFFFVATSVFPQLKFDLGIKGGVNFSKLSFETEDYSAESITKSHFGGFARLGWSRLYVQPEMYYSAKGGDLFSDIQNTVTSVDFSTFDVPVLLGFRIIKGKAFDFHVLAGPVFSKITSDDIDGTVPGEGKFTDNYTSIQYGLGFDIWLITLDARMENSLESIYSSGSESFKNTNFMVSIGFKVL